MKSNFIHFVCKGEENRIIKITKQRKRAEDMMIDIDIKVISYNTNFYPNAKDLKIGELLNEFKFERERII